MRSYLYVYKIKKEESGDIFLRICHSIENTLHPSFIENGIVLKMELWILISHVFNVIYFLIIVYYFMMIYNQIALSCRLISPARFLL